MWDSSVDVGGPHVQRLVEACGADDVHLVIGVNEREDVRPGSLYNTMLILGPGGVLLRHRKTMPTMQERVFHGIGDADCLGRGGAVVIDPMGTVIGGPLYDDEGMVVADCDLRVGLRAKRWFDSVGHYSRPDLFPPAADAPASPDLAGPPAEA